MAKEGSVAPKERVNIRYRSATGDAKEEVELPMKTLVLGDFTGRQDDTPLAERDRINVDKSNFSDVMRSHNLGLDMQVKNRMSEEADETMSVSLKFETLKSMEPEAIANQVPELKRLLELRDALTSLKGPLGNMPAFRKALQGVLDDAEQRKKILSELTPATGDSE
ncbi:MAG: type VI secretion system contractile sheath small subunit [Pseudomonadota bacterium]